MEFPYSLGSTNPCPITVRMEPFSTSVSKDLTSIIATTTKICTNGFFTKVYTNCFNKTITPSYSMKYRTHFIDKV